MRIWSQFDNLTVNPTIKKKYMKKGPSQTSSSIYPKNETANYEKDANISRNYQPKSINIAPLNISTINSSPIICSQPDSSQAKSRSSVSAQSPNMQNSKLGQMIKELFIEIRNKTLTENQNAIFLLKKTVPMDEDDDKIMNTDPIFILTYIRHMFTVYIQLKTTAEQELAEKKDIEGSDYEPMLQKLEAEVRQHIRIEQQLKLYVESTQSKADDTEKENEILKKELEDIKMELNQSNDKYKKKEGELESLKKELKMKIETIQNLEQQLESMASLKTKIRELEKQSNNEMSKSNSHNNTLRSLNSAVRETNDPGIRNSTNLQIQNASIIENNLRKTSQPITMPCNNNNNNNAMADMNKHKPSTHKDKENIEILKIDPSRVRESNIFKSLKNNFMLEKKHSNQDSSRIDKSSNYSKYDDKSEEVNSGTIKNRKSSRQDYGGGSKEKIAESELFHEERLSSNIPRTSYIRASEPLESSTRNNLDKSNGIKEKGISKKYLNKEHEENENDKNKYKRNASNDRPYGISDYGNKSSQQQQQQQQQHYSQGTQERKTVQHTGNNIPKPSRNNECNIAYGYLNENNPQKNQVNHTNQVYGTKKENVMNSQEIKAKMTSPKPFQDTRSQSVDGTNKFYRQLKAKIENGNDNDNQNIDYTKMNSNYNTKAVLNQNINNNNMNFHVQNNQQS